MLHSAVKKSKKESEIGTCSSDLSSYSGKSSEKPLTSLNLAPHRSSSAELRFAYKHVAILQALSKAKPGSHLCLKKYESPLAPPLASVESGISVPKA